MTREERLETWRARLASLVAEALADGVTVHGWDDGSLILTIPEHPVIEAVVEGTE
jgi:hypothetical protein